MNKKKRISIFVLVVGLIAVAAGIISYAYWQLTKKQTNPNDMVSACLNFEMVGASDAIILPGAWPTSDENGQKHPGYTFTIENKCDEAVNYVISLESLVSSNTNYLSYENIRLLLDQKPVIDYESLETIESFALKDDTESIRDTKKITIDTVEGKSTNTHNIKIWLADYTPIEEQNSSFRSRIRITGGQEIENDAGETGEVLATGNISRTEECTQDSSGETTCAPVTGNNVIYKLYDNNEIVISGTGDPKKFENSMVYEIMLNIMENNSEFTEEEKELYKDYDNVRSMINIAFGLSLDDFKILGMEISSYTDLIEILEIETKNKTLANSLLTKLEEKGLIGNTKNVVISDGINKISDGIFSLSYFGSITMADTVTTIEKDAFENTMIINSLILSNSLTVLEDYSLAHIIAPRVDLVLPNSVVEIGNNTLLNSEFKSLRYPDNDSPLTVGLYFVAENVYIPENIITINYYVDYTSNINLYCYGPERTLSILERDFKSVVWNYTD